MLRLRASIIGIICLSFFSYTHASCLDSISPAQREHFVDLMDSMQDATDEQLTDASLRALMSRTLPEDQGAVKLSISLRLARDKLRLDVEGIQKTFFAAAQEYMKNAQVAASFIDLVEHTWKEQNLADVARDKNYKIMDDSIKELINLGFNSRDLLPYRKALIAALQSTDYESGMKQLDSCLHLAYASPVVVPLFMYLPVLAKGFFIGMATESLHDTASAIRDGGGDRHEALCELSRSLLNHLPKNAETAVMTAPVALLPWRKVPWKYILPFAGMTAAPAVYHQAEDYHQKRETDHALNQSLKALNIEIPSDEDRLKKIDQTYFQKTGKHMSQEDILSLKKIMHINP